MKYITSVAFFICFWPIINCFGQTYDNTRSESYFAGEPLRIGNRWQLLLDETVVEDRFRLTRQQVKARKHPHNPVLVRDKPWEGDGVGPVSVIWDPGWGKFRMWYRSFSSSSYYGGAGPPYFILYAESDDGLNWDKPLLDIIEMPGFKHTNVVYTGSFYPRVQGPQVWRDEDEPDSARRYKMISLERRIDEDGRLVSGVQLAYSNDGLHWSLDEDEEPLLNYHSDTYNHVVRAPNDNYWLLYCRPILRDAGRPARGRRTDLQESITGPYRRHSARRVSVAVSEDLYSWSFPRTVLYPDERDAPDIDQSIVFHAGSGLLMLYAAMDGDVTGQNEIKLASSSDGFHWNRYWEREPYIARGTEGTWDSGSVSTSGTPVAHGEFVFIYYNGGILGQHEAGNRMGSIGVAMTKTNRFVEQSAGDTPGFLLTKEFILEGDRLLVNTTGSNLPNRPPAELRVEILLESPSASDASYTDIIVPGFSLADCDVITGDRTKAEVTWNGSGDLSPLKGKPVYLRFQLRNKGLCAFQIINSDN